MSENATCVAIMTPGDMGHAVGRVLAGDGFRVITSLEGRSGRTRQLAAQAGIADAGSDAALAGEADVILSILPPSSALDLAERLAPAIRAAGRPLLYVDANAISPATARAVEAVVTAAGARFADGGIIGPPPSRGGKATRIYVSGEHAGAAAALSRPEGLDIRVVGPEVGAASALKMCYAAITKGLVGLATQSLVAARALGVDEALQAEMAVSQAMLLDRFSKSLPGMPPKAYRWVGEMEEIAATYEAVGLPGDTYVGQAKLYRLIADGPLGSETVEARTRGTSLAEVTAILADALEPPGRAG